MTDEHVKPTPLRTHLILGGAVLGLLIVIGIFLSRHPMECQEGYVLASTWRTQSCMAIVGVDSGVQSRKADP